MKRFFIRQAHSRGEQKKETNTDSLIGLDILYLDINDAMYISDEYRVGVVSFDDTKISEETIESIFSTDYTDFSLSLLDDTEVIVYVKDKTKLSQASVMGIIGEKAPYLVI